MEPLLMLYPSQERLLKDDPFNVFHEFATFAKFSSSVIH